MRGTREKIKIKKRNLPKDREKEDTILFEKVRGRVPGSGRLCVIPGGFGMQAYQLTVGQPKFTHENPAISHGSRDKPIAYLHCHCPVIHPRK